MTYPPQPPGPYGRQQGGPYGHQPGRYDPQPPQPAPYAQQPTAYQGLGSFSGGQQQSTPPPPPPNKSNTNMIIAVVLAAVLVLGGAGAAIFFLTKGDDGNGGGGTAGAGNSQANTPGTGSNDNKPGDDKPSDRPAPGGGSGSDTPAGVQEAYIQAYEAKQFGDVVQGACTAYKDKFGTDTTELESQLEPYTIKATADGRPDVTGSTAIAKIDLELTRGSETKRPKIKIKIVKEDGKWRFCGEGEA